MSSTDDLGLRDEGPPAPAGPGRARRFSWRWAVNAWLVFHLGAIVLAPASVSPSSDLVRSGWDLVAPYLQALYLNHGYHFFAPEPDFSTLLAYEVDRADGTTVTGRIPDKAITPRVLYHRHFMLTEKMAAAPEEVAPLWHESYAEHLRRRFDGTEVRLTQVTHLLSSKQRIREGGRLDDPESYEETSLGAYRWDEN